ncbi:ACP phosphodiesterase [Zhouia sp. PK063]|uniref:acyl carrier protein phosphodiesterase n=1 Tax=Zhouia sp. PK063 TaxID=3373602 RepID=UPI0037ACFFAC
MNFLAHLYLSDRHDDIMIGNFIADSIRGNKYEHFPLGIQKGIKLHREIDTFTDAHPVFRQSTKRLHPFYSHYSGVIIDIFYDHFLAKNWEKYSNEKLTDFATYFYQLISSKYDDMPEKVQYMIPYMIKDNWLVSYAAISGIQSVLNGMNRRTKNKSNMHLATKQLQDFYTEFETEFYLFFDDMQTFAKNKLNTIL